MAAERVALALQQATDSLVAIAGEKPLLKFIESAGFAFLRNLVLVSLAVVLLRRRVMGLDAGAAPTQAASNA